MKRSVLLMSAMSAALAYPAWADDLNLSTSISTPVKSSAASNGTAGNIDIEAGGSIGINAAGAAVTIDSSDTLINEGVISNGIASNGVGLHILGGVTSGLTVTGAITVGTVTTGTGNIGVLIDGTSPVSAIVATSTESVVNVNSKNAVGFAFLAPVVGDVSLGGSIIVTGEQATGFLSTAPITGMLSNSGVITVNGTSAYNNAALDPQSGYGVALGASVSGGFLNAGPLSGTDITTPTATISAVGSNPAFYISPRLAGAAAADLTLGVLNDTTNPGFSFVNRGTITSAGNDPGVSTTAVRIEGDGTHVANLPGGFYNRGTIRAASTSDNTTATTVTPSDANATGLAIGAGGIVAQIYNDGTINGQISGPKSGTATGVLIEAGGSLPSLTNTYFITANAYANDANSTNLAAYAIRDLSGTLTSITNSGTISVSGTATTAGTTLVAADLSHATTDVTFTNSGTIQGVINFGQAQNNFIIDGANALASGRFQATGSGTLDIALNSGKLQTDDTTVRNLAVGPSGTTEFALGHGTSGTSGGTALVTASGDVSFAAGSRVTLTPTSFLPAEGNYTLIAAGGDLSFADFASTTQQSFPFLLQGAFAQDSHNLFLTLHRKTATELGLTGNEAAIYEPAAAAAALDDQFGAALLSLDTKDAVNATMASLLPNTTYGTRALTIAVTDQSTGPIGVRQRDLMLEPKKGLGFWSDQFYNDINGGTTATSNSFFGSGYGIAMGAEWGEPETGRYGVGYTYFAGQVTESQPRPSKQNMSLNMFSLYGGWRWQDFFVTPEANLGIVSFTGRRSVTAGSVNRIAQGDWTGYLASSGITSGLIFNFAGIQVMPQISIDGLYVYQTGYGEHGGGDGVNLHLGTQDLKSIRLFAGVVAQSAFNFEEGRVLPRVLAGWSRELTNDSTTIDASFEALPGSSFALVGPTANPSKVIGGAGLSYVFNNWSAGVNYDASRTTDTFAQSATVSLTSKF